MVWGCEFFNLFQKKKKKKKLPPAKWCCFAKIARDAYAAALSVKLMLNFKLMRANLVVPPFPEPAGSHCRAGGTGRGPGGGERSGRASIRGPGPGPMNAAPPQKNKYRRQVRSSAPASHLLLPAEGTAYQWQVFCILSWVKSRQQRDIFCPCSRD